MPSSPDGPGGSGEAPLLSVRNLKAYFPIRQGMIVRRVVEQVKAVDDVSFDIARGETLGMVGESGCGKTTIGRSILRLIQPTAGSIVFDGIELTGLGRRGFRRLYRRIQMIYQDSSAAMDPRMSVGDIIAEPLEINRIGDRESQRQRVRELLDTVRLGDRTAGAYPHELSGGQRQRVGIARALAMRPDLIVCDEPVSALDVSIQAQIINLLEELQEQFGLTYLFIAHDLSVVRHISDRVAVMYLGKMMELTSRDELYENPLHPYTKALLSAVPIPDPEVETKRERILLTGDVPSPMHPPPGCVFNTRCPIAIGECRQAVPEWREVSRDHWVACHRV